MTYSDFTRKAYPITALIAVLCAGWALNAKRVVPIDRSPAAPAPTPTPSNAEIPPSRTEPASTAEVFPPPGAVLTATPGPGPESVPPPAEPGPGNVWLSEFDRALDKEFGRIEAREKTSRDPVEQALIENLKAKLLALDELWRRADQTPTSGEKVRLQQEAQQIMGEIIQLGRADRNQRLTRIARQLGLSNPTEISHFIDEVDQALVETHLDWASLFNRGVETPADETVR